MFSTNKKILAMQEEIDFLRGQLADHKRVLLNAIKDFCETHGERFTEIENQVSDLSSRFKDLDGYDDNTRAKFRALESHLGIKLHKPINPDEYEVITLSDTEDMEQF